MESYRVTNIPNSGLQQGYSQPSRPSRAHNNGAGTYGLSIRVQGIDGHPYVVLNNQDRGPPSPTDPNSNGYIDTEGSFIDNYHEYDFRGSKESSSNSPFVEYRSQKLMHFTGAHNGASDSQGKKPSTLLNFQKHPEILQPYDPENNSLNLDGFHSLPSQSPSLTEMEAHKKSSSSRSTLPVVSHSKSSSLDESKAGQVHSHTQTAASKPQTKQEQSQPLPQAQLAQPQARPQPQVAQSQSKTRRSPPSNPFPKPHSQPQRQPMPAPQPPPAAVSSPTGEQNKTACRSPSTISSANSSLERSRREPDVLPLRRTDSSGPVLQTSSRSRHSSTSSNNTTKALLDDQMEVLYADTINRHQNRRYIPFLPGTGRDIDTGSIPGVDELIEKFDVKDGSQQRRGRAGRRNRINPEDRKRSRSVDSALPFGLREASNYMDEFSKHQGTSMEHVLRPSQLRLQKVAGIHNSSSSVVDGKTNSRASASGTSTPTSPQSTVSKGVGSIQGYKKPLSRSSTLPSSAKGGEEGASLTSKETANAKSSLPKTSSTSGKKPSAEGDVQVTPDLLKGQQELSQQTHEETAKQILFNYLKDGSNDNDDTTKRKVNLVFEKIQTLKSRAAGSVQSDNKSVDFAAQTKALQEQNAELEKQLTNLKTKLDEEAAGNLELDEKTVKGLQELQKELERSMKECSDLKEKLNKTEAELQNTLEELFQVKMEREQYQTEIRDLQDQLSEMHDELDTAKKSPADGDRDAIVADLMQLKMELQEVVLAKEEQEEILRRRERELTALKGALKEEVATHDQEVDKLREQYEKEISRLQTCLEEAKQNKATVSREKAEVEAAKGAVEGQAGRLTQEAERLRKRAQELENEVAKLNRIIDEAKLQESRLGDRVVRLERDKKHLDESLSEIKEQEEEMSRANRALTTRLEDVQRNFAKLSGEHKELEERLKEEKAQKELFKNTKNEIEDERRLLDRTVEKLQREMNEIVVASQSSTQELQEQIDIYKEKNRRELSELQRQLKDRSQELETCRLAAKTLQGELSLRDEELRHCKRERDEAVVKEKTLAERIRQLEAEVETSGQAKDDKSRHAKLMEDRISQLELDLDEERRSGDQLMDRIDRGREQVEQMRNDLLQERASRQDLECDKIALERQNKDLKSRVTHLEGSQKSNKEGLVAQLELRIQELEERLEGEERERSNLQLANRRLERKVKEMMMQVDEEHHSMQDQKDQLNLRLKALKRQMDEAEEEIDRLEHSKKKLQRDLDEQQEANEQLQSQLKALRNEIRRKSSSAPLLTNLDDDDDDDDDISTDGETYFSSSYKRSSSQDNIMSTFTL
ncbi:cingulin-like protein 1 isoform X2 [Lampris incognitus]|uniref:cingulin-like protein 1 isoform X2 n=1 Tax=Lampris incognitus TaxID=2546036 RepID=UPI0024B4889F|nr:cingulin-like protein 1 isoform X2 [Lampris incognitus]